MTQHHSHIIPQKVNSQLVQNWLLSRKCTLMYIKALTLTY